MYHEILPVYEDEFLKITQINGISDENLTVAISSSPRIGETEAPEEFILHATDNSNAVFVIDKTNSFGNHFDWDILISTVKELAGNRKIRAVGFCLGGFLSIALSKHIKIDSIVAITPQYSILPEYMNEGSFMLELYTQHVKEWKIETLDGCFMEHTQYYIFENNEPDDVVQQKWFPFHLDNVRMFNFGDSFHHGLPGQLGEHLHSLVKECWAGNPDFVDKFIEDYYEGKIEILYGSQ